MQKKVFLCYSDVDIIYANEIKTVLEQNEIYCVTEYSDLKEAIKKSNSFLLVLSKDTLMSEGVSKELKLAMDLRKPIIPIDLDDSSLDFLMMGQKTIRLNNVLEKDHAYQELITRVMSV